MSAILLLALLLPPEKDLGETQLRYVRATSSGFAPECVLTIIASAKDKEWLSVTDRGTEKMVLRVRWRDESLMSAEIVRKTSNGQKMASLTRSGDDATLVKGAATEKLVAVPANAVVTTAPDWTDIFLMIERYDAAKGGKQEFPGVWIHPEKATLRPTFSAERLEAVKVIHQGKSLAVDRYRIRLRSGDYAVWADSGRRVLKLQSAQSTAPAVVLEGYEDATRDLK